MHELSIALNILDIAAEESGRRGGALIQAIHIRLGPLSGVVKDALVPAFELARESSPFPDCRLLIEEAPILVYCPLCQGEWPAVSIQKMCCSRCETPSSQIVSGQEMEIFAMQIADLPARHPSSELQKESSHE